MTKKGRRGGGTPAAPRPPVAAPLASSLRAPSRGDPPLNPADRAGADSRPRPEPRDRGNDEGPRPRVLERGSATAGWNKDPRTRVWNKDSRPRVRNEDSRPWVRNETDSN